MSRISAFRFVLAICVAALNATTLFAQDNNRIDFREVLTLAGVGPDRLSEFPARSEFIAADWQIVLQVLGRLEQFRDLTPSAPELSAAPDAWLDTDSQSLGKICEIEGNIVAVERITLPKNLIELSGQSELFVCSLNFDESAALEQTTVEILSSRIPKTWDSQETFDEPVLVRGVLLQPSDDEGSRSALFVTNHIAWFPSTGAPTGQLLLAKHGMDVALLDEVVHRQPFVKPTISREGEAFYAGLKALRAADLGELTRLAKENIGRVAKAWSVRRPELVANHRQLVGELAKTDDQQSRARLALEVRRARTTRDLATTIAQQAENHQSSVATMFLQPEQEVGELFYFQGTARRAVWIAVEGDDNLAGYYELEIYPSESRLLDNRPVVCCVTSLPENFPTGDQIREPVQIAGVFFKSWRYRSRELIGQAGQTEQPRQLYTPVLLGKMPGWISKPNASESRGAFWGGIVFLGALVGVWISLAWLSKRDRAARRSLRPNESIDLENLNRNQLGDAG